MIAVFQGVLDVVVVGHGHLDTFDFVALGELDADTGREFIGKTVSGTDLSHTIYIECVNDNLGDDQARVHVRGYVSVDPDGATKIMESHFGIHLDFHGQVLMVVFIHLLDEFGVR